MVVPKVSFLFLQPGGSRLAIEKRGFMNWGIFWDLLQATDVNMLYKKGYKRKGLGTSGLHHGGCNIL